MLLIYGAHNPKDLIHKISSREDKYNICEMIHLSMGEEKIKEKIDSDSFFGGRYVGKVIEIDSSTRGAETEENIKKLLTIEKNTNPIEIVLHV